VLAKFDMGGGINPMSMHLVPPAQRGSTTLHDNEGKWEWCGSIKGSFNERVQSKKKAKKIGEGGDKPAGQITCIVVQAGQNEFRWRSKPTRKKYIWE
jgi:hypothetical protein